MTMNQQYTEVNNIMSNAAKIRISKYVKSRSNSNMDTEKTANLVNEILRMTYYESI